MMNRNVRSMALAVALAVAWGSGVLSPRVAYAQINPEALRAGKDATALVESEDEEGVAASAFCIDPGGLFVTSAHAAEAGSRFRLILHAGRPTQVTVKARVVRSDKKSDLALLQAEGAGPFRPLELGRDDELIETMDVVAFGYPFGKAKGRLKGEDVPSVSVNTGRITSLPSPGGKLSAIQLDVVLNPGNSGGPVLDRAGKVIGVVQGGIRGSGVNFAVPVGRLAEMLESPVVLLEAPGLSFATRQAPADWTVRVIPKARAEGATVGIALSVDGGEARTVEAKPSGRGDGTFVARVAPVPGGAPAAATLAIRAEFPAGQVEGRIADRAVTAGGRTLRLSEVATIRTGPPPTLVLHEGAEVPAGPAGIGASTIDLGGPSVTVDLAKASRVELERPRAASASLRCTVTVRKGGTPVATLERGFELTEAGGSTGAPGESGPLAAIKSPALDSDRVEIKLPGAVTDVVQAAGGRLLLLVMRDLKKLAVFDVNAGKVVRLLGLPADDALVVAGSRKFLVLSTSQGIIQRWDLATLERERVSPIPIEGSVWALAMGSASNGPVMYFATAEGRNGFGAAWFGFLDLEGLRPIRGFTQLNVWMGNRQNVQGEAQQAGRLTSPHFSQPNERVQLRASPGGEVFAAWSMTHSPEGMLDFIWKDRKTLETGYEHSGVGYLVPGPDARTLFTRNGLFGLDLKPARGDSPKMGALVPSTSPGFFVGLQGKKASLFLPGNTSPLVAIGDLAELEPAGSPPQQYGHQNADPIADKRVVFIVAADLLVTIPRGQNLIVLRRARPLDLLRASRIDYLFVQSVPIAEAERGKAYEYALKVQSRKGGVKYELNSGPDGMAISPEGKLSWNVPGDFAEDEATPVVLVKDAGGQEVFHTFTIRVR